MTTIFLLRHLKSSWDGGAVADHERPLNARGRAAGPVLARHLGDLVARPSLVLCSSAGRARETLEAVRRGLPESVEIRIDPGLYLATAGHILQRLRAVEAPHEVVLVVGHNPGLQELALLLAGSGDAKALARIGRKLPTGGLVMLSGPGPWRDLRPGGLRLDGFVRPKDLPAVDHGS